VLGKRGDEPMLISAIVHQVFERLKERKIVQWALAYLAGAWAVMQVWDLVARPWELPQVFPQALQVLLAVGFFVVLVVAWYHGEKERERVSGPELLMVAVLMVVGGIALSFLPGGSGNTEAEVGSNITEFDVQLPFGRLHGEHPMALSPSGDTLAFVARDSGVSRVYLRAMDNRALDTLDGTERAEVPFFSPDGSMLAFFADGELKKVPVGGGNAFTITRDVPGLPKGGVWGANDTIYYDYERGIHRISADGGERDSLPPPPEGDLPRLEQYLPGHPALLATLREGENRGRIAAFSLKDRKWRTFPELEDATQAKFTKIDETGYLIFSPAGNFFAVEFDVESLEVKGKPFPLDDFRSEWVEGRGEGRGPQFDVSETGTMVFMPRNHRRTLMWGDGNGLADSLEIEAQDFARPRISPDGNKVAIVHNDRGHYRIALVDVEQSYTQVLTEGSLDESPAFAPNGAMLIYASRAGDRGVLSTISVDGRFEQRIAAPQGEIREPAWSPYRKN